jgi:tRNA dimethylallyltransferase
MDKIISIVGITASGKSGLGIEIAKKFNGEIISADSRQVYRGLDIGTAKVTAAQRAEVRHHLIDVVDAGGHFQVYDFQHLAYAAIDDILLSGRVPIIVGGTGLYSRSVVEGYNFTGGENRAKYDVLQICLLPSKDVIRPLVARRIDERIGAGMFDETRELIDRGVPRGWLQALGLEYFWNVEYLDGRVDLKEYKKQLLTKTMQFAKRQRTWFKREKNTHFLTNPETFLGDCVALVERFLK